MARRIPVGWLFILPTIIFLLIMTIFPLIWSLALAFCSWKLAKGGIESHPEFIGLGNFLEAINSDRRYWNAMGYTWLYTAVAVTVEFLIGLGLAILLSFKEFRGRRFFRVAYLVPMACPPLGVAFMWRLLLHEDVGVLNKILMAIGLGRMRWMTDPWTARFALIMVDIWQWTPFMFLALLAALQALPVEPYEAALIDGASRWQILRYITLPMLKPVITTILLLRTIDCLKLFDYVYGITRGGPGLSTESASYYIYLVGLSYFDFGYASALSYILLVMMLALSMMLILRLRRGM